MSECNNCRSAEQMCTEFDVSEFCLTLSSLFEIGPNGSHFM
jgi:hypothetical protein